MQEKIFKSQKYFIFKLADILNNSFHSFEEKRRESLQLVIELCMDTYEEMHSTPIGTDKLEKSYKALLEGLIYLLKKHPFRDLPFYKMDFERVLVLVGSDDNEKIKKSYELYIALKTLKKKLGSKDLMGQYAICLQQKDLSYKEIDILIESMVSDLLYNGYSLNYLNEWYSKMKDDQFFVAVEEKDLNYYIERLKELNCEKKAYEVIIPYRVKSESQKEIANQLLKRHFTIKKKDDFRQYENEWKWSEELYACKEYIAVDYYKAIRMAKNDFLTDKELFSMWQNVSEIIRENVRVGCIIQNQLIIKDLREVDNTKLINYFDRNRAEQLNTFIELKDMMKNEDVDILERVLHMLHTAKTYNIQNRYLNFWSAIEYCIYPFPRNSIIEKARILVPEAFTLFYVKNKMNIFWERLRYTMSKKNAEMMYPKCKKMIETCKGEKDFDTKKLIEFLQKQEKYTEVLNEISFHVVLEREMRELIMLVTEPKKLKSAIEEYHESVVHDLNFVYRLRNQLIHSAKSKDDLLEHISLRLYRYVNSIVATILYYKKRNADVSIIEILNSLHNTYEVYLEQFKKNSKTEITLEEGYKYVRPQYLFLE